KVQQGDVEIFKCLSCPPSDTCLISFTWQPADCNTAQFTPQPVGIILVNTYSWDVNCDGVPESTEAEPVLTLGECGAALPVCLTVEYLDGRTCSYEEMVSIPAESMPPVINCSGTYDYSTDPGACYYTGGFGLAISDNCDPAPEIFSYSLTGDTQGSGMGLPPQVNEGVTYVTATAIDNCGNESLPCTFRVTVVDEEAPQIQCPGTVVEQVPGCSDGANVSYPDATAIDNCQLDGITYDISSGSFFSCDQTVVTATATDIFGNSSQCSFSVVVNGCRDCASICGATLDCGAASGQYLFDICVDNLTTLPDGSAVVGVSSQDGVVSVLDGELPGISGAIEVAPPLPAELTFVLSFEFPCPFGVITCVDSITVATPCCEEITVDGLAVCAEEEMISIPLQGDLPFLTGVDYIKWYVAPAPCESFVLAYQAPGIADLPFFPALYSEFDSACVYAEVAFLPGRPCSRLVSDIATIYICQPGAGSLENANGPYCSDALPAVFEPITFSSDEHPACAYTIQWYQDGEAAPGATSDTYVPTGLSFTGGPMDCSSEHLITAEVTNLCGATGHNTTITIYNSEAPTGELFLDPDEAMPFCPGEDATLRYDPKCVGPDPSNWRWCVRTADTDYQPIEGAGATNATWNTNPLDEDTWYSIKKKNGACPEDTISLMIDVREELSITGFSAMEDDDCYPGQVDMAMAFTPLPGPDCEIFVFWYKDGLLLGTTNPATSPATFTHSGPVLAGNYYAVAEDVCCDSTAGSEVVYIGPPMEVGLIAPCFRCNDETIILEGFVENPPEGAVCTYQWLKDGVLIPNANDEILVLYEANATFTFRATCSDCTKEVSYFLLQCGNPVNTRVQPKPGLAIRAVPNPTSGQLSLRVDGSLLPGAHYRLIGQWGRSLQSGELLPGREEYALSLERLPAGLYFIQVFEGDRLVWVEKVVLQE
ncbi:MAG: HYR domain-containing protein, partial [Phaeodactylibacter sp.]|nr:HYR domain-containing protein [Phaeodactylibacter sp.]